MDNRTCNELFLRAVANKYSISFEELERGVFDKFIHEDPDPNGVYLHSTKHFDRFVKEHEIKEVNVGTVVLYLKGVKMVVSHQEMVDEIEDQNTKVNYARFVLGVTAGALLGLDVEIDFARYVVSLTAGSLVSLTFCL